MEGNFCEKPKCEEEYTVGKLRHFHMKIGFQANTIVIHLRHISDVTLYQFLR